MCYAAPNIEDNEDSEEQPEHVDTMAGLSVNDKPKPKRKRKSRAKQRPESQIVSSTKIDVPHISDVSVACVPKPLHGPAGSSGTKPPSVDSGKQMTPQDRRPSAKPKGDKHRVSPVAPPIAKPSQKGEDKKKPKRRCRKRDPAEQPSQPWTEEEIVQFRALVKAEGATAWKDKSAKLARLCGNVRTPKALHTRYLREIGRIVDRPRGQDQLLQQQSASSHTKKSANSKKPGANKLVV